MGLENLMKAELVKLGTELAQARALAEKYRVDAMRYQLLRAGGNGFEVIYCDPNEPDDITHPDCHGPARWDGASLDGLCDDAIIKLGGDLG